MIFLPVFQISCLYNLSIKSYRVHEVSSFDITWSSTNISRFVSEHDDVLSSANTSVSKSSELSGNRWRLWKMLLGQLTILDVLQCHYVPYLTTFHWQQLSELDQSYQFIIHLRRWPLSTVGNYTAHGNLTFL